MKFTTAAVASTVVALAVAGPCKARDTTTTDSPGTLAGFQIIADAPGSDFDGSPLQASRGSLLIGATSQNASCGPEPRNYATFSLADTELSLYTANPPQIFFTDASGMGQGVIRYTTGAQQPTRYGSRKGFTLTDAGTLVYRFTPDGEDVGFQACGPALSAKYSVWLGASSNPGGYSNCTKFTARVEKDSNAEKCQYSQ